MGDGGVPADGRGRGALERDREPERLELVAGILSRATRAELALEVGVGIALGLGVLVLQIVLR
ncbi:MAG TPA: hypothetical protein VNY35_04150 [Solirubrobacteraceae bacterium]|nr:hypothetical protein [Solirubrobacteraceae bacterium]